MPDTHKLLLGTHGKLLIYLAIVIILFALYMNGVLENLIYGLHELEYPGAFVAGMFYTYGMTTPFAITVFAVMAGNMNPFILATLGASGALLSDFIIFSAFKEEADRIIRISSWKIEISELTDRIGKTATMIIGGVVLISPLPDEVGAAILGIGKETIPQFLAITFIAKFLGILLIAGIATAF